MTDGEMIEAAIAAGRVTQCPPRYVAAVNGALPIKDGGVSAPTSYWNGKWGGKEPRKNSRAKNPPRIPADVASSAKVVKKIMQTGTMAKKAARVIRIVREIGDDWTSDHIALIAMKEDCSTKTLRQFLRDNDLGHRVISVRRPNSGSFVPGKSQSGRARGNDTNTKERNASIVRAYEEDGASVSSAGTANGVSVRTAQRVLNAAGVKMRPQTYHSGHKPPTALDWAMAAMYLDGWSIPQVACSYGYSPDKVVFALKRTKTESRGRGKRSPNDGMEPPDFRGLNI